MTKRPWGLSAALVATLALGATQAGAQASSHIKQGFDAAWARQPEQRAAGLRREAAAAQASAAARWTPGPASLEVSARTDRVARNEGVREYDAAIAVPLWLPGERSRSQAVASSEAAAVDARLGAAQWRLAAEVRDAYWAQQRARLEHGLAEQRLASAQQLAADVSRRLKAGDLARSDAHQAGSAVAAAESALAEASVAVSQTRQNWLALTGQTITDGVDGAAEQRPAGNQADAVHPALRELSVRGEVARRHRDLAAIQTRANPEVMIGAVHERDGYGARYGQSVVVGLRIPLGASSGSRARQATASAEAMEVESQAELEAQRVRSQIELAKARLLALEQAQLAAERRAVLGRESRGFFEKSFRLGESDLPTRLRIELEAFEAERQAARSRLEVSAAISQLRQALGLLPE